MLTPAEQDESISTIIEQQTLDMILDLLDLPHTFGANTFTTGATASNILGLSLAREHTISRVQARLGQPGWSVGESGFGGIEIDVFCAGAHASVAKSASLVGIGRRNVVEVLAEDGLCAFDLVELERRLRENVGKRGSVVVSSFGEVNTGAFTPGTKEIRELCDRYDAWLHVDAGASFFPRCRAPELTEDRSFRSLCFPPPRLLAHLLRTRSGRQHHLGRSQMSVPLSLLLPPLTLGAGLNVPYDCGIFLSRSSPLLHSVLGPGTNAPAYLTPPTPTSSTPSIDPYRSLVSPLFLNIENSRRFRTLPVWASLVALGKEGYREIVSRNIEFARKVEAWMRDGGGGGGYEVLTPLSSTGEHKTLNILLFAPALEGPERFRGEGGAARLVAAINGGRECYVTATRWRGGGAIRMAVSNWGTTVGRDYEIVVRVLEEVMRG